MSDTNTEDKVTVGAGDISPVMDLRRTIYAVAVFYLVLLLLNAGALHESVEHLPFGPARTFWLKVTGPFARGVGALGLDRPRALLKDALGSKINRPLE